MQNIVEKEFKIKNLEDSLKPRTHNYPGHLWKTLSDIFFL